MTSPLGGCDSLEALLRSAMQRVLEYRIIEGVPAVSVGMNKRRLLVTQGHAAYFCRRDYISHATNHFQYGSICLDPE
jgi:hypothetical protein